MAKKKILCTGSCGFIFSNFIRYVLRETSEYAFVSVDKIDQKYSYNNLYANKGHKFYIGDISNEHFMDVLFDIEKPDIVINGAAESFVDESIKNPNSFITSNVLGTQVVVNNCLKYNVDRLVQISTDEIYGQLMSESEPSWTEESPLNPRNAYSASKASAELVVRAAGETHGLKYNITRSCNNFGPRQSVRNFIPKVIKNVLEKKPIPVYGEGAQIREWIHVADNCGAILKILRDAPLNEIYNISSNYEISNIELVNMLCNILGQGHSLIEFVEDRRGHDFRYSVSSDKLKNLGWKPSFKFKNGLETTCNWYIQNGWFLR